ncbi:MAG: HAD-IA family hydrolase [Pseudomonadota bacterium]
MKSIFFGSIGAVAETSAFQRRAYNQALKEAGLNWQWDESTYRQLLNYVGGQERLRLLADATGTELDDDRIAQIHARKTELACAAIVDARVPLRPGIAELSQRVRSGGGQVGFVTTTYKPNIDAIFDLGHDGFTRDSLDVIVGREDVERGKPAPDAYQVALARTGLDPADVIAIEDTVSSAKAAKRSGLRVILTPGTYASGIADADVDLIVPSLMSEDGVLHPTVADMIGMSG